MAEELEMIFGRKVDLLTRKSVEDSPNYIRRRAILDSAQVIYVEYPGMQFQAFVTESSMPISTSI
jgi:hypothetical protein